MSTATMTDCWISVPIMGFWSSSLQARIGQVALDQLVPGRRSTQEQPAAATRLDERNDLAVVAPPLSELHAAIDFTLALINDMPAARLRRLDDETIHQPVHCLVAFVFLEVFQRQQFAQGGGGRFLLAMSGDGDFNLFFRSGGRQSGGYDIALQFRLPAGLSAGLLCAIPGDGDPQAERHVESAGQGMSTAT